MARLVNTTEQASELRRQAEYMALRQAGPACTGPESTLPAWVDKPLDDLRAHLLELELQNEALRRTQFNLD